MITLAFNLFPISVNKLYLTVRGQGRRFISPEGKVFKKVIEDQVKTMLSDISTLTYISSLQGKRLAVELKITSPSWVLKDGITSRRKDCGNLEKALTDSIFKTFSETFSLVLDDSQIWDLKISKQLGTTELTEYTISEFV